MDDYISREAAKNKFFTGTGFIYHGIDVHERINEIPAADVRPVKRGEWEWDENGMDWNIGAWRCSCCKTRPETWWNMVKQNPHRFSSSSFCGNCGADMRPEGGTDG